MSDTQKMHANEVDTSPDLVRRLLTSQFPQWAGRPITAVASTGTVNAIYRVGDDLSARLPRIPVTREALEKEHRWLPILAPRLPLATPTPIAIGEPGAGYPFHWAIHRWLDGHNLAFSQLRDPAATSRALAAFVSALQQSDIAGGPLAGTSPGARGGPLAARDASTRAAIDACRGLIDTAAAITRWETTLRVPVWPAAPVWVHGDLMPGNLLFVDGQLSAVIDFGLMAVGDPAADLQIAWNYLDGDNRAVFRTALNVDDATWARGRGWALSVALIQLPYYQHTNPALAAIARRTIHAVLAG